MSELDQAKIWLADALCQMNSTDGVSEMAALINLAERQEKQLAIVDKSLQDIIDMAKV